MNILFINTNKGSAIYGIEHWMMTMAENLIRLGHGAWIATRPGSELMRSSQFCGIPVYPLRIRSFLEAGTALRLRNFLRRSRITGICTKTYKESRLAALASSRLPITLICRRGNNGDIQDTLRHRLMLKFCMDGVLVPSYALQNEFCRIPWIERDKIYVMLHEIDPASYQTIAPAQTSPCSCRVIFIGRLMPVKGLDTLLKAWVQVVKCEPNARLLLVGDGMEQTYKKMAATLRIAASVDFVGFQPDIRPWIAAADLLVLPSRREGGGYVSLEAMAMGRPVIGSNVGGIPEYMKAGETGLLVPVNNETALSRAILELVQNPDRRVAMGKEAYEHVRRHYTAGQSAQQLVNIFGELLQK